MRKLTAAELAAIAEIIRVDTPDREITLHSKMQSGAGNQRLILGQALPVIHQILVT